MAATVPGDVLCAAVVETVRRNIQKKKTNHRIVKSYEVELFVCNWLKVLRWHGYFQFKNRHYVNRVDPVRHESLIKFLAE